MGIDDVVIQHGARIQRGPNKRTSGLHMSEELYRKAKKLAKKEGISTNAVLVQLIEIGLKAVEQTNNKEQ